jgi:RNA-directed DNA polymerase
LRGYRHWIATGLSHALLADIEHAESRSPRALLARGSACLGGTPSWLKALVTALHPEVCRRWQSHTVATLSALVHDMPELDAAFADGAVPRIRRLVLRPARMAAPCFDLAGMQLPALGTHADLAAWLAIAPDKLAWLASAASGWREPSPAAAAQPRPARHYHCALKPKARGGLRLLEVPKPELKRVQQRLLSLLDAIPVHEAAQGFVKGRGVLSHVAPHARQHVVIAFDLRDFFHSVGAARIRAFWRALGFPEGVAATLASLCTARTPIAIRERLLDAGSIDAPGAKRLASPHLAQGAPTSPALSNLCAFGLDLRLDGLAWRFGARYSRYADDIVFSGPPSLLRHKRDLHAWVEAIVAAEGFSLNPAKTRVLPQHRRQRVTGVVVNSHPNLERGAYDRLRAELHQHVSRGTCDPQTRGRLQGEVSWACQLVCASRAEKLRNLLGRIGVDRMGTAPAAASKLLPGTR